jgi:hypothetical protein
LPAAPPFNKYHLTAGNKLFCVYEQKVALQHIYQTFSGLHFAAVDFSGAPRFHSALAPSQLRNFTV